MLGSEAVSLGMDGCGGTGDLPLYLSEGVWLRFGPQNDLGVGIALATLSCKSGCSRQRCVVCRFRLERCPPHIQVACSVIENQ
jgi:hypothetical protein